VDRDRRHDIHDHHRDHIDDHIDDHIIDNNHGATVDHDHTGQHHHDAIDLTCDNDDDPVIVNHVNIDPVIVDLGAVSPPTWPTGAR